MRHASKFIVIGISFTLILLASAGVAQTCPCTIWSSATTPGVADGGDPGSGEYGVRFRADVDGSVIGVRFYKSTSNGGPHSGELWTDSGTPLAAATFGNESASGWQQVFFNSPVPITAGTTYIASYFTPAGHYSFNSNYFVSSVDNPPLHALANSTESNAVYAYSPVSTFPTFSGNTSNYWADVIFMPNGASTTPAVISTSPASATTGVPASATVSASFNQPMNPASINASSALLFDSSNNQIAGTVSYDSASAVATITPNAPLLPLTTYTATIRGVVTNVFGTAMGADFSWSFTTQGPPPNSGPGGPILVISSYVNPFTRYFDEILRSEGMNEFTVADVLNVSAATLSSYDVVIVGDFPLTSSQVSMLANWVNGGGKLIAMHPDHQLAGLLGLQSTTETLSDGYLAISPSGPGNGIVNQTIQFHGAADLYNLNGASSLARLFSSANTATPYPAVTLVNVGNNGGQAATFTYDLARSVVYTRQGDPAWSGQARSGLTPIRPHDLFFGDAPFDPQPDWINFSKVAIPQADEQQRFLVNLVQQMNQVTKPLPRFWYLPSGSKAAVIMTGDDHNAPGGTAGRFDAYLADSPSGCSVADWKCVRATSYVFVQVNQTLSDSQAASYIAQGFEIAAHVDTDPTCTNFTLNSLARTYAGYLVTFHEYFPSAGNPATHRMHCVGYSDYDSQPKVELSNGIRLDTTYYYYPDSWMQDITGLFTGSGMPMRFADRNGNTLDIYQAATQLPDEDTWTWPSAIDTLLDNAIGPQGYYAVVTANMHTDTVASVGSDAIVASAQARGIPIVSSAQMLTWLDGRNDSSFKSIAWNGNTLSFTISVGTGARNLQAMVPINSSAGSLSSLSTSGTSVNYTTQTIKGVQYAFFAAVAGSYQATYGGSSGGSFSISGTISGAGGSAASVALTGAANATTTADTAGNYAFSGVANGVYTVTPSNTGFSFTPTSQGVTVNGGNITGLNFSSAATGVSLSSVVLNPATVTGGTSSTGTVTLSGPAPAGGVVVSLSDSNTAVQTPANTTVAAGSTTANFTVTTSGVATATAVTVSATYNGVTVQAGLTINPPTLTALTLSPTAVVGGTSSTGTVRLNGPAPSGGALVTLSDNSASAQTPGSVTVAAGATSATFRVTTSSVTSSTAVTVSATWNGTTVQAGLTINPATLSSLSLSPTTVVGGNSSTGTVRLNGPAPSGGALVTLSDNSASAQTPGSVTVAAGATSASFTVTTSTVTSSTSVTMSATYNGATVQAGLTVNPPTLSSLVLRPTTVVGGNSSTGTVTLSGPAPSGGAVVTLSDNSTAAQTPASVTVAAGSRTATFTVTTIGVASSTSATITATFGVSRNATLTISVASLSSLVLSPSTVTGGSSSTGTLTLNGAAPPAGAVISLSSSNTSVAQVPASTTVPAGARSITFTVTTSPVQGTSALISASYRITTVRATLTVQ